MDREISECIHLMKRLAEVMQFGCEILKRETVTGFDNCHAIAILLPSLAWIYTDFLH